MEVRGGLDVASLASLANPLTHTQRFVPQWGCKFSVCKVLKAREGGKKRINGRHLVKYRRPVCGEEAQVGLNGKGNQWSPWQRATLRVRELAVGDAALIFTKAKTERKSFSNIHQPTYDSNSNYDFLQEQTDVH